MSVATAPFSLSAVVEFIRRLFSRSGHHQPEAQILNAEPPALEQPQPQEPAATAAPAVKQKRKTSRKKLAVPANTLSSLLDSLDITFDAMQLPPDCYSHLPESEIKGLKSASPLVVQWNDEQERTSVNVKDGLPTAFILSCQWKSQDLDKDYLYPDFVFGTKVAKVPWNVTRLPGVIYRFGLAWRTKSKRHFWGIVWLSVLPDGSVRVGHELSSVTVKTPHGGSYDRREWLASSWRRDEKDSITPVVETFCQALTMYQSRRERWNVSVRKNGRRAIFLVNPEDTSEYFKGRDKTALTAQGKRRPIIHHVRAHTQQHGDKVVQIPEHIRGLRSFVWNGYECAVTAPQFHTFLSSGLELAAIETDEQDDVPNTMRLEELANKLADAEDYQQRRKKSRRRA